MTNARQRVLQWVQDNFNISEITTEACNLMPGGIVVRDRTGDSLLAYLDVLTDQVEFHVK